MKAYDAAVKKSADAADRRTRAETAYTSTQNEYDNLKVRVCEEERRRGALFMIQREPPFPHPKTPVR